MSDVASSDWIDSFKAGAKYSMAQEFGAAFWIEEVDYQGLDGVLYCARLGTT